MRNLDNGYQLICDAFFSGEALTLLNSLEILFFLSFVPNYVLIGMY